MLQPFSTTHYAIYVMSYTANSVKVDINNSQMANVQYA